MTTCTRSKTASHEHAAAVRGCHATARRKYVVRKPRSSARARRGVARRGSQRDGEIEPDSPRRGTAAARARQGRARTAGACRRRPRSRSRATAGARAWFLEQGHRRCDVLARYRASCTRAGAVPVLGTAKARDARARRLIGRLAMVARRAAQCPGRRWGEPAWRTDRTPSCGRRSSARRVASGASRQLAAAGGGTMMRDLIAREVRRGLIEPDRADGVLDQLALHDVAEESAAIAKIVAHWLTFAPLLLIAAVPAAALLAMDGAALARAEMALAVGTPGLASLAVA